MPTTRNPFRGIHQSRIQGAHPKTHRVRIPTAAFSTRLLHDVPQQQLAEHDAAL